MVTVHVGLRTCCADRIMDSDKCKSYLLSKKNSGIIKLVDNWKKV